MYGMAQKTAVLTKTSQAGQLYAMLEGQETERDRIGRELHDSVGALLTTTRFYFHQLKQAGSTNGIDLYDKIDGLLSQTIDSVRRVSANLRPVILENLGLTDAMIDYIQEVTRASGLNINFEVGHNCSLSPNTELNIYRVVQEMLNNALRHSGATQVSIEMDSLNDDFFLRYLDNCFGLPETNMPKKGIGLKNMESREAAINGELIFKNAPCGGLIITIEIKKNEND